MKVTLVSTTLILLVFGLSAQTHRCAFDSTHAYRNRTNPDNKKELRNFMLESKKQAALLPKKDPVSPSKRLNPYAPGYADYVIPIVVHVIHNGGASNISDAQINNQVNELNGYFQPYGIQFCLAKIMPDGTPFNGITWRNHALSKYRLNLDEAALMSLDLFPRDKYLNIWVVDTILDDNGVNRNQIGAGSYPDERKLGVVIRHDFFGNDVTCGSCALNSEARGKTLVHELGHFFGLLHTHENGCAGNEANTCDTAGDFICDTPPMVFVNFTCRDTNTCKEKPNDRPDPIHNFMSYKAETCLNEFTVQQMEIIRANIEVYLETLIDPTNIKLVGGDSCGYITALFNASNTLICGSGSVTFKALDSVPISRTYNWIITKKNGSLLHSYSSSYSMLTYNFTVPDEYTITLEVVGSTGIISRTRKAYVKVINCGNKISNTRGNWYFGEYAGLEFRQFATIPNIKSYDGDKGLTNQNLNSIEGCIVQNNAIGQLLFYGGGKRIGNNIDSFYIFDKNHNPMPHGRVLGTSTSSYGGVVVPVPGSKKRYYLFTTNIQNFVTTDHYGFRWSIIDTSLNGNNGDVDTNYMNKPLKAASGRSFNPIDSAAYTGEGICAIPGCDSSSYWLIINATKYTGATNDSTVLS